MLAVNGENVVGLSVAEIRERIVGPIGSEVSIALESGASGQVYERVLVRGNAQPATQAPQPVLRAPGPMPPCPSPPSKLILFSVYTNFPDFCRIVR
jgi:hypothetical protein